MGLVVQDIARVAPDTAAGLADCGVSTVHEAIGRRGLMRSHMRPIYAGARICGPAVTVSVPPGDNWMIHVAVEQCRAGDILVVTTTSPSLDGSFGELFATALQHRGVRGLVTTGGVRDAVDLRAMGFPVWSGAVNAQGTVKATAGSVNVPITVGGAIIRAGDVIVADDDGVVCVPRDAASAVLAGSDARVAKEAEARAAYQAGELSLDRNGLRAVLADLGVVYVSAAEHEAEHGRS